MKNVDQEKELEKVNKNMTIDEIQNYFEKIFKLRGFSEQTMEQKLLLLVEEVGELVKAHRKEGAVIGVDYARINNYDTVEREVADVFIVLIAICIKQNISLFDAVKNKEKENVKRVWGETHDK